MQTLIEGKLLNVNMVFRNRMKFQYNESNNISRIPGVMGNKVYICVSPNDLIYKREKNNLTK